MILFQMAFRNLRRGGLRTWLNVIVLAIVFVSIIFLQGFNAGILEQASDATIRSEIGAGQFRHPDYDPYDPLTLDQAHGTLPAALAAGVADSQVTPILIVPGTLYPEGRLVSVRLNGIDPAQTILDLPMGILANRHAAIPAVIGSRMATSTNLRQGDIVTMRWRDREGTFDARDIEIVRIINTPVASIDQGQVWLSLDSLRVLADMPEQATLAVLSRGAETVPDSGNWTFHSQYALLSELRNLVQVRSIGNAILNGILLMLGLIAILDTQILSVFRRRKEIGTLISLGMTRGRVIRLFTLEGSLNGIFACLLGAAIGAPLFWWMATAGYPMPQSADSMGIAIGNVLYPRYGAGLIGGVTVLMLISVTVVSMLPSRRIARMKPTDALRGRTP